MGWPAAGFVHGAPGLTPRSLSVVKTTGLASGCFMSAKAGCHRDRARPYRAVSDRRSSVPGYHDGRTAAAAACSIGDALAEGRLRLAGGRRACRHRATRIERRSRRIFGHELRRPRIRLTPQARRSSQGEVQRWRRPSGQQTRSGQHERADFAPTHGTGRGRRNRHRSDADCRRVGRLG